MVGDAPFASACACGENECGPLHVDEEEPGLFERDDDGWHTLTARSCFEPDRPLRPGGLAALDGALLVADGPRLLLRGDDGLFSQWNQDELGWPHCLMPFPDGDTRMATGVAVDDDTVYVAYRMLHTAGEACLSGVAGVARYERLTGRHIQGDWANGDGILDPLGEGIPVDQLLATDGALLAVVTTVGSFQLYECLGGQTPERQRIDLTEALDLPGSPQRIHAAALGDGAFAFGFRQRIVRWHPDDGISLLYDLTTTGSSRSFVTALTATEDGLAFTDGWGGVLVELSRPE